MATSDIDQKVLAILAKVTSLSDPLLSSCLYQILGLSVLLSRKLYRARKLRRLDSSRDTKSLSLYYHVIWLSREGLTIVESYILPRTQKGQHGSECHVLSSKLRASFYHVFCLFNNNPPVSNYRNIAETSNITANSTNPGAGQVPTAAQASQVENEQKGKAAALRDPIPSMTSETSYVTNPYANGGPAHSPPIPGLQPLAPHFLTSLPPGLAPLPLNIPLSGREPASSFFLLPRLNYVPLTQSTFSTAFSLANDLLPGSHPLRLSVALEYAAFLWDCARDERCCRRIAREAVRGVYADERPLGDADFEEAASLVGALGRWIRRRSSRERIKAVGKRRSGEGEKVLSGEDIEALKKQEAAWRRTGGTPGVDEGGMVRDRPRDAHGGERKKEERAANARLDSISSNTRSARANDETCDAEPPLSGDIGQQGRGSKSAQGLGRIQSGSNGKNIAKIKERANDPKDRGPGIGATKEDSVPRTTTTIRPEGETSSHGGSGANIDNNPKTGVAGMGGTRTMPGAYF